MAPHAHAVLQCVWQWSVTTDSVVMARPALGSGNVYFISQLGTLYCANEATGSVQWTKVLSPTTTSLALTDNGLLLAASSSNGILYAVGVFQNPNPAPSPSSSSPPSATATATRTSIPPPNDNLPAGSVFAIVLTVLLAAGAVGAFVYFKFLRARLAYASF